MLLEIGKGPAERPANLFDLLMECHGRIRQFAALAVHVGRHRDSPDDECVEACARVERYFTEALPLHVADEEESLLPRLRGQDADVDRALATMAEQHAHHEPMLAALLDASMGVRERPSDPERRAALYEAAVALEAELINHLQLEEQVVLPAIGQHLSADDQTQIVDELRARRVAERSDARRDA
jgi:iron-sulfur cluster repair protein YtfE (RIC family)